MDNGLRNTIIGFTTALVAGWVQINSRVTALETRQDNDHELLVRNQMKADQQMKELINKVEDIQLKVNTLYVKMDVKSNEGISNN